MTGYGNGKHRSGIKSLIPGTVICWFCVTDNSVIAAQGCFADNSSNPDLTDQVQVGPRTLSPETCIDECRTRNYQYAGLQVRFTLQIAFNSPHCGLKAKIFAQGKWYSCRGLAVVGNSGVSTLGFNCAAKLSLQNEFQC